MSDVRFTRTIDKAHLARVKAAREEADAAYNAALSALDAALPRPATMPHPSAAPDETQVTPLNEGFNVVSALQLPGGLKGRLLRPVWALVAPLFARQEAFNAALVDHINRNVAVGRSVRDSQAAVIETLRIELERLATFHSALIMYLQQITPYVDCKDYEFDVLAMRRVEDVGEAVETLHHRTVGPGGAISGVGDELNRRLEMLAVRERRYEARVGALDAAHAQLAQSLGIVTRATQTLKREVEHLIDRAAFGERALPTSASTAAAGGPSPGDGRAGGSDGSAGGIDDGIDGGIDSGIDGRAGSPLGAEALAKAASPAPTNSFAAGGIESFKYVGFEDRFRGSATVIRERLQDYVALFASQQDVLDIGCGRGEFLDLLRHAGIRARGLDINHEMVEVCRQRGLDADEGDALGYLRGLADESLGGLFAAQVVEHLDPDYLVRLLQRAGEVLRPGGVLVLETVNVACWFAFFQSYVRDITHVRPLHPDTLAYFVRASGFPHVEVQYRSPYPQEHKLQHVPGGEAWHYTVNANVDTLNSLLFTHLDYAVVARKP